MVQAKYATEFRVALPNGQWLTPSWALRPAKIVDKPDRGWDDEHDASCLASQVGGTVVPHIYEYVNTW